MTNYNIMESTGTTMKFNEILTKLKETELTKILSKKDVLIDTIKDSTWINQVGINHSINRHNFTTKL